MTYSGKTLTGFAITLGLLWAILGGIGLSLGNNVFASDETLTASFVLKTISGACFSACFVCIVGLLVISAVREMLGWQPLVSASTPGAQALAASAAPQPVQTAQPASPAKPDQAAPGDTD